MVPHDLGGGEAYGDQRCHKAARREVFAAEPVVLRYIRWSEILIFFDHRDHPDMYSLIVEPIMGSKRLTKVLMDGGVVSTSCTSRPSMDWTLRAQR
jgi:hypothetical protein